MARELYYLNSRALPDHRNKRIFIMGIFSRFADIVKRQHQLTAGKGGRPAKAGASDDSGDGRHAG